MNSHRLRSGTLALAVVLCSAGALPPDKPAVSLSPAKEAPTPRFAKVVAPFLTKHCYSCHGGGKSKGDLTLDKYHDEQEIVKDREVWEDVVEMVRTGQMPPKTKDRPRPTPSEADLATQAIDDMLDQCDCTGLRNDGRVTIRRLNRTEYNNTVRDLVGVDFKPAADFPNDDVGYGFDNIGDVLSLSPLLLEKYLAAAEAILERAIVINEPPRPSKERLSSLHPSFRAGGARRGGGLFLNGQGQISGQVYVDEGDYTISAQVFGQQVGDQPVARLCRVNRDVLKEFDVTATETATATIEAKVRLKAGTRTVAVAFLNPYTEPAKPGEEPRRSRARLQGSQTSHSGLSTSTSTSGCWSSATSRWTVPTTPRRLFCPRPTSG